MASKSFIDLTGLQHYDEKLNEAIASNYVNLTGTQTITGAKTFSNPVVISKSGEAMFHSLSTGNSSSDNNWNLWMGIGASGKGGFYDNTRGTYIFERNPNGTVYIRAQKNDKSATGTYTFGTDGNLSATTFTGALSGNASTATKLATARSISAGNLDFKGSASFDGSGNIALNVVADNAVANVNNKNNYPYHRFAYTSLITGNYVDYSLMLLVNRPYYNGGYGICYVTLRTNNASGGSTATLNVQWLARTSDLPVDSIQAGFTNTAQATYADLFYKSSGAYATAFVRVLGHSNTRYSGPGSHGFTLVSSNEVSNTTTTDPLTSTECYATIAAAGTALREQNYTSIIEAVDAGIIGTASNANQLATGRSIWGKTFDGTANISGEINYAKCLEFDGVASNSTNGGYIDFHFAGSTADYTSRIIEDASGRLTIPGQLCLTRTTDAAGTADNGPALRIGAIGGAHLELDGNELMAKNSGTTVGELFLNNDGGQVTVGSGGLKAVGNLTTNGSIIKMHPSITKGTNPSAVQYWTLTFSDKNGSNYSNNCLGMLETSISAAGVVSTYIRAMKNEAASSANCQISCIYDTTNNTAYTSAPTPAVADSSTKIATTAWCRTATGNFACNAATATKATQDGSGNVITTTYATKSELNDITSVTTAQIDTLF